MTTRQFDRGFSLLEALMATAITASALGVLAHLAVLSTRANVAAALTSVATGLAADKADVLSSEFTVAGSSALPLSPPGSLQINTSGHTDFFDARGRPVGAGPVAPPGAVLVRRWSAAVPPGGPSSARLVHVVVLSWPQAAGLSADEAQRAELVRLTLVRAGQ